MTRTIGLLLCLMLAVAQEACAAYRFEDLPAGWAWERDKILGELLPAEPNAARAPNDPNLWLVPLGHHVRTGGTNGWVEQLGLVSVVGGVPISTGLFLFHDPNTHQSTTWQLDSWSVPGPWYITVDAFSFPRKGGTGKVKRYTIVGAGYLPEEYEPGLE